MVCAVGALVLSVLAGCSPGDGDDAADPTPTARPTVTASSLSPTPAAPSPSPSASGSPAPATSAPASASPSPVPVTGPDQKLVTMTVSGGFAGVSQQVVLRGDGTVHTTDRGETGVRRTTTAQFTTLRTLLGDPALAEVPAFSLDMGAADKFQYTLQFGGRTIMTDRSADEPALGRLIGALKKWLPKN